MMVTEYQYKAFLLCNHQMIEFLSIYQQKVSSISSSVSIVKAIAGKAHDEEHK